MKAKLLFAGVAVLLLAGCTSFTELTRFPKPVITDDGERALGSIEVTNVGYDLFFCLPLCSGHVWQEDDVPYAENGVAGSRTWFDYECTVDENLKGLKRALKEFPSKRIANLTTYNDSWSWWSLFIIRRRIIRTNCTVLEAK